MMFTGKSEELLPEECCSITKEALILLAPNESSLLVVLVACNS